MYLLLPVALGAEPVSLGPGSERPFERVIAFGTEGEDVVRVVASTSSEDSCETLSANPRSPKGATVADLTLTARPEHGALVWTVSDVAVGAFSPSFRARPTSKVLEVDPSGTTRFEVEAVLEDSRGKEPPYRIAGTLEPEPCGRKPAPTRPAPRPQPGKLVYGGIDVPLQGAILKKQGEHLVLSISSHPASCRDVADANVVFQMQLDGRWNQANGHWTGGMSHSASYSFSDAEGRALTLGEPKDGVVRIDGSWTGKTFDARAVATGPFDALDCR